MSKTVVIKGLFVFPSLAFFNYTLDAQCLGPTTTGNYTNGKQPTANGNYFINHVFSTFTSASGANAGMLNGNSISINISGGPTTNNITSALTPLTPVTGSGFPTINPSMHRVSTNNTSIKI